MQRNLVESVQLSWLRAFIAVNETGSFTAAAAEVHRAQSRVSAQVAQLEAVLGVQLLIRGRNRVQLTAEGSEYLQYAQSALLQLEAGGDAVAGYFGEIRGHLTVKAFPGAAAFMIAPLIRRFHDLYPSATVTLKEGGADPITDVARNNVDFALLALTPGVEMRLPTSITAFPLFTEPVVAVLPSGHPSGDLERVPPSVFASTTIMTGDPASGIGEYSPLLAEVGITPAETQIVGQPTTATALVDAGVGIAILPSLAAHMLNTSERVKLARISDKRFVRTVSVVLNRTRHYPPIATKFMDELRAFDPGHWIEPVPSD